MKTLEFHSLHYRQLPRLVKSPQGIYSYIWHPNQRLLGGFAKTLRYMFVLPKLSVICSIESVCYSLIDTWNTCTWSCTRLFFVPRQRYISTYASLRSHLHEDVDSGIRYQMMNMLNIVTLKKNGRGELQPCFRG